jgi:eukaryotic-like serine/threonine-protein kinase
MIGTTLAHYRILALLGKGGQAKVYRARDLRLEREVAVKVPLEEGLEDPRARTKLMHEARMASQLNHPHVCIIHEVGEADGTLYIAMELIRGQTLQARIPPGGLPTASVLRYGTQIADALAHAHAQGLIHRDLKSLNVMVTDGDRVKVLDFGLARAVEGSLAGSVDTTSAISETGAIMGTPSAMAPETLDLKRATERTDLWSFGVLLYEMVCGRVPFRGAGNDLFAAIRTQDPDPLPASTPSRLADLIDRCLKKDPDQRLQTAAEAHKELEEIIQLTARTSTRTGTLRRILVSALLVAAVIGIWKLIELLIPPPIRALAVLPLENLSTDPSQTYFADGMTEELIGNLGQIANLRVISRNSVMRYRNTTERLDRIARELGVDLLVTGSVRPGRDSVRIVAHLIEPSPERELWSAGYTRGAREVLALQSDVAQDIAKRISVRITSDEQTRIAHSVTVRPEAYEEYLRGRSFWNLRTADGMQKAIVHYRRAIELEPGLALAHAGLANTYARLSLYTNQPPNETYPEARAAAKAALRLDDGLAEAHAALAAVALFYDRDWTAAQAEFRRAIALQPSYPTAHHWYSIYLRDRGRFADAVVEAEHASNLDPASPILRVNLADTHYYAGQYDRAVTLQQQVIAADSSFAPAWLYLGMAYDQAREPALAVQAVERAWNLNGRGAYALGALGYVRARAGDAAAARRARAELVALSARGLAVAFDVALIHVGLGEKEEAVRWLRRADDERAGLNEIAVDPRFAPLRSMPEFKQLLVRLGLSG